MEKENNDLENLYKSLSDIAVKIIVSDPSINDLIQKTMKQTIEAVVRDKLAYRNEFGKQLSEILFGNDKVLNIFDGVSSVAHTMSKLAVEAVNKHVVDISKKNLFEQIDEALEPITDKEILLYDIIENLLKDIKSEGLYWSSYYDVYEDILKIEIKKSIGQISNIESIDVDICIKSRFENKYNSKSDISMHLMRDSKYDDETLYQIVSVYYKDAFNGISFMPYALHRFSRYLFNVYCLKKPIKIDSIDPSDYSTKLSSVECDDDD